MVTNFRSAAPVMYPSTESSNPAHGNRTSQFRSIPPLPADAARTAPQRRQQCGVQADQQLQPIMHARVLTLKVRALLLEIVKQQLLGHVGGRGRGRARHQGHPFGFYGQATVGGSGSPADSALPHLVTGHQAILGIGPGRTGYRPHRSDAALTIVQARVPVVPGWAIGPVAWGLGRLAARDSARSAAVGWPPVLATFGGWSHVEPGECSRAQQSRHRR
jgi:hypothetical protein